MKDITLLHLGDIHFNGIIKDEYSLIDYKDDLFPLHLTRNISPKGGYPTVLKSLLKEIQNSTLAILISGDLCVQGHMDDYQECLSFLNERIDKRFFIEECPERIFIVPGNHDVDRESISAESIYSKFETINKLHKEMNFPLIPMEEPLQELIHEKDSQGSVLILAVNSCIGCGEKRYYPTEIRDMVSEWIDKKEEDKSKMLDLCYDRIDTPIITEESIEVILRAIKDSCPNCLPIILTHHNLLPPRTPRVAIYTELMNSGYILQKLLSLNRTIIYLHGHIHDDTVVTIQDPFYENARIICISAPLLCPNEVDLTANKFGFNKLKIIFGSNSIPIGCKITFFRLIGDEIKEQEKIISFINPARAMALITYQEESVLNVINHENPVFLARIKSEFESKIGTKVNIDELEKAIDRLNILGLIEYERDGEVAMRKARRIFS